MFLVIGMSPGNSYFKQEVITQILTKTLAEYEKVGILIPDIPAISTYRALGYPENRARRDKALPQGNALKNKVGKAIETLGVESSRVRVFDWEEEGIDTLPAYQEKYAFVKRLYDTNPEFKKDADATTKEVLTDNSFRKGEIGMEQIETGVHYLLSEIAFMLFVAGYVGEDSAGYAYHRPWPVFERFIAGAYDGTPKPEISFVLLPAFA